jgi:hypothetical protein
VSGITLSIMSFVFMEILELELTGLNFGSYVLLYEAEDAAGSGLVS